MNNSILMAIESMCDDIATSTNADDNKKRAEAIVSLAFGGLFTPEDCEDEELAGETAQDSEARKTMPQAGEHFNYNGMEFIVLGKEQGGILAVAAKCLEDEMPFDEDNCNDWRKSSLRRYLNEEYIKGFNRGDPAPLCFRPHNRQRTKGLRHLRGLYSVALLRPLPQIQRVCA